MMIELTDFKTLYQALLARDEAYEGRAYVGVSSTGVFCRLTCPARKPKPENCSFYPTIAACLEAGYRPCKRCHPLGPEAKADPLIGSLIEALEADPAARWSETRVAQMGFDPSTVRRIFKRHYGMTFLELARQRRLQEGFSSLAAGQKVIAAQHEALFDSASAFRRAFAKMLGCAPSDLKPSGRLLTDWIATPLGDMISVSCGKSLHLLEFVDRKALPKELTRLRQMVKGDLGIGKTAPGEQIRHELALYFAGQGARFETSLVLHGTAFTQSVWQELQRIPAGATCSYSELAHRIGRPEAVRAVARANGANQLALVVPCHRVLGADGTLTGYGGGLWRKQRLIEIEQQYRSAA